MRIYPKGNVCISQVFAHFENGLHLSPPFFPLLNLLLFEIGENSFTPFKPQSGNQRETSIQSMASSIASAFRRGDEGIALDHDDAISPPTAAAAEIRAEGSAVVVTTINDAHPDPFPCPYPVHKLHFASREATLRALQALADAHNAMERDRDPDPKVQMREHKERKEAEIKAMKAFNKLYNVTGKYNKESQARDLQALSRGGITSGKAHRHIRRHHKDFGQSKDEKEKKKEMEDEKGESSSNHPEFDRNHSRPDSNQLASVTARTGRTVTFRKQRAFEGKRLSKTLRSAMQHATTTAAVTRKEKSEKKSAALVS